MKFTLIDCIRESRFESSMRNLKAVASSKGFVVPEGRS